MTAQNPLDQLGRFTPDHIAFLSALEAMRPRLYRYCARMTGSPFDGEDVVQEAIYEAFSKRHLFDSNQPLAPWLIRIAHNRCIDLIRRRKRRAAAESAAGPDELYQEAVEPTGPWIGSALEYLIGRLPAKERACILLKDVLDYSLEETAELVGSTVNGVKAALKRGRAKLAEPADTPPPRKTALPDLHLLYIDKFNRRDWEGLRALISEDAQLRISDIYAGTILPGYFTRFEDLPFPFRLAAGELESRPVLLLLGGLAAGETITGVIRLESAGGRIVAIRQYVRCPWLLEQARLVS